jgi:hypothetical protein
MWNEALDTVPIRYKSWHIPSDADVDTLTTSIPPETVEATQNDPRKYSSEKNCLSATSIATHFLHSFPLTMRRKGRNTVLHEDHV